MRIDSFIYGVGYHRSYPTPLASDVNGILRILVYTSHLQYTGYRILRILCILYTLYPVY